MNIHEYQAKTLFEAFNIPVTRGAAIHMPEEILGALDRISSNKYVVKAQIHAGGRGKGAFVDGLKGGVKLAESKEVADALARKMLGNTLITHQTGPEGRKVNTVYFSEAIAIDKEYYLAILLDRASSQPVIVASTEGGVEIEKVAEETPEKITKVFIDPTLGLKPFQARLVAYGLGFQGKQASQMGKIVSALYRLFCEKDCSLVEINPLISTPDGDIVALDAKVSFDDNALFRHPDITEMRDLNEENPKEVEASKYSLNYIALDGNIACMVNGAGLAMATMDIIKHYGGNPANFLDVGGSATAEQVTQAFKIILSDPNVKGILVNIFGGIMQCDVIAAGIIEAAKAVEISVPLVVRLEGTNVDKGKKLLEDSGLAINSADSLGEAAQNIIKLVNS
jgi:succinyl-CoA synthetase beta subunit